MSDDDRLRDLELALEQERAARAEAEAAANDAIRTLFERRRDVELLGTVAAAANSSEEPQAALMFIVKAVCAHTGWPVGHAYLVENGEPRSAGTWVLDDPERYSAFRELTESTGFRNGRGLPGHVLTSGTPQWVSDISGDQRFVRGEVAMAAGLRSTFAFPLLVGSEVVAVLEFFSPQPTEPDRVLLALMSHVGVQGGRVIERARARDELERSNADLEQFAYRISHDLHEPLRTITAFAGLIERRHADTFQGEPGEFLGFIVEGARRMQDMITGLLQFSRAGRLEVPDEPVESRAIVDHALRALRSRIEETGARITVDEELPRLRASESALGEVFQNLIGNALKFAPEGEPPEIHVGVESTAHDWCFFVADQGIGIHPGQRDRAFDVFQRLMPSEDYEGAGIGLAVCRRIVERHGGRIWVDGNERRGSVFRFTLPR